ncbi:hypothetical protein [Bremerella cremea]|nr:hypothetical protein [Bremerella cremea]
MPLLPMVYTAIGRRLRYPISLATTNQHVFCRWDGDESFCFEPASQGFNAPTEDYYRKWPFPITPKQEQDYGHIRPQTQQEEFAMLAGQRANCLMDNFQFESAVEALACAKQLAPSNAIYHNSYKRGFYTAQLWNELQKFRQLSKKMPFQSAIGLAALELRGDAIETFVQM